MQKKKNRVTKAELFRKRKSMQSNPKLEEKSHIRHNPLRVRDWQMRMSKESGEGDTEETDIDADADDLFQQINNRRTFGSFGAINPLLLQQMGEFGGVSSTRNRKAIPSCPGLALKLFFHAVEKSCEGRPEYATWGGECTCLVHCKIYFMTGCTGDDSKLML